MLLKKIELKNYTVFENQDLELNPGINIFIGENGTGKTHLMKVLYAACQAADARVSFPHKIVLTMLPDDFNISRLVTHKTDNPSVNMQKITHFAQDGNDKGFFIIDLDEKTGEPIVYLNRNQSATVQITAFDGERSQERVLSVGFDRRTNKWNADVTGEKGWEESFAASSSIFIPAKEILSNSYNLNAAVNKNNVKFDDTYLDILNAAKIDISSDTDSSAQKDMLKEIEKITQGPVQYNPKTDEFYLKTGIYWQEFNLVAEGIRKMALLWQLVKNGALKDGSVLFWDEPEANINPAYIEVIVDILLALQRKGVQIFLATHDYMLASYFEVKCTESDNMIYHSFSRIENGTVAYESNRKFGDIKNNAIITAFDKLLDQIYDL